MATLTLDDTVAGAQHGITSRLFRIYLKRTVLRKYLIAIWNLLHILNEPQLIISVRIGICRSTVKNKNAMNPSIIQISGF